MIFPQLGPTYYNTNDKAILSRMEAFYAESITINQSFWGEADTDSRFMANDQTLWNDLYGNLPANRRRQFCFNRIRRIVNMVSGYQRRNRKSTIVIPVDNGDEQTADEYTKIMMWVNNREGILETISESFEGALVTGMNLLHVWMDYRSDIVSGNIKVDNCSYNSFLIDPYFRKPDLSDCNGLWKRSYLTKRECISLMPDRADEIIGLIGNDTGTARDGKFQFMPESYNYGYKNLLTYDEFYYRDFRTQKVLVDTRSGEQMEWKWDNEERLKLFLQAYPEVTVLEQEIPTVKLAIIIQGKVFYDGPNPMGIDKYPFVPVFCYYYPQLPYFNYRIEGMVRGLRDSQYLYNRRKITELDILESQVNSGWIYKENALVNPNDVFLNGQGKGLALKEEAQITDVQQIIAPSIPPSMIQLSELLGREIQEISGVNEELLGSAVDDKAGILSMLRQGAGLTTLQGIFDQLDRSQKLLGGIILELIQNNFTPGKVQSIIGKKPSDQFYNKAFGQYHAVVEEGLNTSTQRQMQFAQLLQLREAGIPIPDDLLIESATIQDKKKLVDALRAQQSQQSKIQQMQMETALEEQKANIELARARTIADQGLGLERVSRIQENKALAVERKASAEQERETGLLNLVKAIKELRGMDIAQLEQVINIAQRFHEQTEQQVAEQIPPSIG
jgi:hypothetical protein